VKVIALLKGQMFPIDVSLMRYMIKISHLTEDNTNFTIYK